MIDFETLVLPRGGSAEWWTQQNVSVASYKQEHEALQIPESELAVYKLFAAYINAAAFATQRERPLVLDVGCGMFPKRSPTAERIDPRCVYVGLDPLEENLRREYPFICGRLEDLAAGKGFEHRFDLFVFGTSLDHIEDLEVAADAVRALASPGARLVCWNGLQEPPRIVLGHGAAVFRKLVGYRSPLVAMTAFAGYGAVRLPRLLRRMRARARDVERGVATDGHYRWFTEENVTRELSVFGRVLETITLPDTHHAFATVEIGAPASAHVAKKPS